MSAMKDAVIRYCDTVAEGDEAKWEQTFDRVMAGEVPMDEIVLHGEVLMDIPKIAPQYNEKIDAVIYSHTTDGFTKQDFAQLALAAVDQAGYPANITGKIAQLLDVAGLKDSGIKG